MKVLLLGSAGQLGLDITRTAPSEIELVLHTRDLADLRHLPLVEELVRTHRPTVVWNTVAFQRSSDCDRHPEEAFLLNSLLPKTLAELSHKYDFLLLHTSTDYVFDGKKQSCYTEWDHPRPVNTYGISRYCGEQYVKHHCERHYLVRVSCLFGRGGNKKGRENFVYRILKAAKSGQKELPAISDLWISPSYTCDIAQRCWQLLTEEAPFGTYHVVNDRGNVSWYDFATEVVRQARLPLSLRPVSWRQLFEPHVPRPERTPLTSRRGTLLRPWQEGLSDFLRELEIL